MSHITAYYQLEKLPEATKTQFNIKSKARLDCVAHFNLLDEQPLSQFISKKKQMYFYCSAPENYIIANAKRISDLGLTHGSKNLSSIYIPNIDHPEYGYGDFANDCLLFKLNNDLSAIDVFIIKNGKTLKRQYFQLFIDGELDDEIEAIKQQAKPFFNYKDAL
ncbi:MAG: hypothetical protein COA63_004175 [Methylophaga sp.]|nr:hypothetical protein [Methylophaga sp.]